MIVRSIIKFESYKECRKCSIAAFALNGKMTGAFTTTTSDVQLAVVSGVRGGWKRIGDIVFVDVKFNLVAS